MPRSEGSKRMKKEIDERVWIHTLMQPLVIEAVNTQNVPITCAAGYAGGYTSILVTQQPLDHMLRFLAFKTFHLTVHPVCFGTETPTHDFKTKKSSR